VIAAEALPREDQLLSAAGLRGSPAIPMTAWLGASRRRYVARIYLPHELEPSEATRIVVLGVARDEGGNAHRRGVAHGLDLASAKAWLLRMRHSGCNEVHVHRTTADADECRAIARDLTPSSKEIV